MIVTKKNLLDSLKKVKLVVPSEKHAGIPKTLKNVVLTASKIVATDTVRYVEVDLEVLEGGEFRDVVVNFKDFYDLVSSFPDGNLILESRGEKIEIEGSGISTALAVKGTDSYPDIPIIFGGKAVMIDSKILLQMLRVVLPTASKDTSRPRLNCIYFRFMSDTIKVVSATTHTLSEYRVKGSPLEEGALQVPLDTAKLLEKLLLKKDKEIGIRFEGKLALFDMGGERVTTRLVTEAFPCYEQLLVPSDRHDFVIVDTKASAKALKEELAGDKKDTSCIEMGWWNALYFSSKKGRGTKVPLLSGGYKKVAITLNGFNILSTLEALDKAEISPIQIGVGGSLDPIIFRSTGSRDFCMLCMPMRR